MSFTSAICLTQIGNTPLTDFVNVYAIDGSGNQTLLESTQISNLTGSNCPHYLTLPNGTVSVLVIDSGTTCYFSGTVETANICANCQLGFDLYVTNGLRLTVGNLTGNCDSNITEYAIDWYDSQGNIVLSTGHGTQFAYQRPHPLTGNAAYPLAAGTYQPVIRQAIINGIRYSNIIENGFIYTDFRTCLFPTTVLVPYTCQSGTYAGPYNNVINYNGQSGTIAPPFSQGFTFEAPIDKDHIAFFFQGYTIPDTLKITYYGVNYDQPIILEYLTSGVDVLQNNFFITTMPKTNRESGGGFKKILCLTGLTRDINDYITFEVFSNQTNWNTDYSLKLKCLNVNCDLCILENYYNQPYKIIQSSITGITGSCNSLNIKLQISGCSGGVHNNSDIGIYAKLEDYFGYSSVKNYNNTISDSTFCFPGVPFAQSYNPCRLQPKSPGSVIITEKTTINGQGLLTFQFTEESEFVSFYNEYLAVLPYSGTPFNPQDSRYYRFYEFKLSSGSGDVNCGDSTYVINYKIHPSTIVTTGQTGAYYTLSFTMPTISNQLPTSQCLNCTWIDWFVDLINNSSLSPNYTNTSNVAARYEHPIDRVWALVIITNPSGIDDRSDLVIYDYSVQTYPYSANTNGTFTFLPSLSAETCVLSQLVGREPLPNSAMYFYEDYYLIKRYDITDPTSFIIQGFPKNGYVANYSAIEDVYIFSGGTVAYANPYYLI